MEIGKKTNKKAKRIATQRNLGYRIFNRPHCKKLEPGNLGRRKSINIYFVGD